MSDTLPSPPPDEDKESKEYLLKLISFLYLGVCPKCWNCAEPATQHGEVVGEMELYMCDVHMPSNGLLENLPEVKRFVVRDLPLSKWLREAKGLIDIRRASSAPPTMPEPANGS